MRVISKTGSSDRVSYGCQCVSASDVKDQVSFLTYNIEGTARLFESEVCSYICKFDSAVLVETFSVPFPSHLFPLHDVYVAPGVQLSHAATARLSGGVAMLVRKELGPYAKHVLVEYDNVVALKISKSLFAVSSDIVFLGVYLPPSNSAYYVETDIYNGVSVLEQCILDVFELYSNVCVMIAGDLNARTGSKLPDEDFLPEDIVEFETPSPVPSLTTRCSKDKVVNAFGSYLLGVCEQFQLF